MGEVGTVVEGTKRENLALNAIRTAAALLVVVGHARGYLIVDRDDAPQDLLTQGLMALFSLGHGAVLLFFVLSGYFVGGSVLSGMRQNRFGWASYSISRLTRLWLVLIPAVVLTIVLDTIGRTFLGYSPQYSEGSNSWNSDGWTILGNVLFLDPVYVEPLGTNRALWSLTFEFAYYAIFPLLVAGIFFVRRTIARVVLVSAGLALIIFYGPAVAALFPAWLLGALIAHHQTSVASFVSCIPRPLLQALRGITTLALFGAMLWDRASGGSPWYTPPATYAVALLAGVLVALYVTDVAPRFSISRKILGLSSHLANSSYSLYATHLPVLVMIAVLFSPAGVTGSWVPSPLVWAKYALVVVFLVAVGWIFGALTESHTDAVRRLVRSRIRRKKGSTHAGRDSPSSAEATAADHQN
jgi:peptidoglycan/LPS O-acetylase OafA/YrhL